MDNSASATPEPDESSRRRSGRVVKAPTKFAPEVQSSAAAKRKRGEQDEDDGEDDVPDLDDDSSDDDVDADSDEDHPAPRSRKASQPGRAKKPSSKKPKTNGTQPSALGHASSIPSRPKKSVRIDTGDKGTGLFGTMRRSRLQLSSY